MQEIRRLKPSTTSRRMSIVAGFYRTAVIDGLIDHSPAEHVRRPHVPPESPTLGLTHLQLEALLTAARLSPDRYDFALVCLLGYCSKRNSQSRLGTPSGSPARGRPRHAASSGRSAARPDSLSENKPGLPSPGLPGRRRG